MRSRTPKQLLFAFFGEYVVDAREHPIRTSALIRVLEEAGIAPAATRATLDRLTRSGFLERERRGRELLFSLSDEGAAVLREATERVRGLRPFDPHGAGWTLVTFSIPEGQRHSRHRLRAMLTWEGFAPIRDGLWIAPGEVELASPLAAVRADLPDGSIVAFHAREVADFPIAQSVQTAWDIDAIRAEHSAFIEEWSTPIAASGALATRVMLVADWLELLRIDPRLPARFMDEQWPSARSVEVYHQARAVLREGAEREFAEISDALPAERSPRVPPHRPAGVGTALS